MAIDTTILPSPTPKPVVPISYQTDWPGILAGVSHLIMVCGVLTYVIIHDGIQYDNLLWWLLFGNSTLVALSSHVFNYKKAKDILNASSNLQPGSN